MARTHEIYELKADDRRALEAILRSPKAAQSLVARAKVILLMLRPRFKQADYIKSAIKLQTFVSARMNIDLKMMCLILC